MHGPDLQGVSERQRIHRGQSRDHISGQRAKICSFGDMTVDMLGSSSSDTDWSWGHLTLRVTWLLRTSCQGWQECTLWVCYQTQIWLLSTWKSIIREARVSRQESFFNQKSQQSREIVDLCPEINSQDSALLWIIEARDWVLHPSLFHADWLISPDVNFPMWLAKGTVRGRESVIFWLLNSSSLFLFI